MPHSSGWSVLTDKVPELSSARGLLRALAMGFLPFVLAFVALKLFDRPGWRFLVLIVQLALYALTYRLLRDLFQGPREGRAYTDAFFGRFLPAAGLNLASLAFILFNSGRWVLQGQEAGATIFPNAWISWLFRFAALYLIVTAVLLMLRSVQAAGIDSLSCVYVYYADEGRPVEGGIYALVRHPAYAGLDRIALAFGIWNGSAFALLLAVLFVAVWHPAWYGLEETELGARFGEGYRDYRERVPAVLPRGLPAGELALLEALSRRPTPEDEAPPEPPPPELPAV